MSLPVYLHSLMQGAPSLAGGVNGSTNALLLACLVNGFNTQSVTSATASSGVVTLTMASGSHGFSVDDTVLVAGATSALYNTKCRVASVSGTTVTITNAAAPDGTVAGTLTAKFSPLGWTRPYSGTNLGAYQQGGTASHKRFLRVYDGTVVSTQRVFVRAYEAMTAISTGTGPFPTTTEASGNGTDWLTTTNTSSTATPWAVIGTPRAFYLFTGYAQDYSATPGQWLASSPWNDVGAGFFGELDRVNKTGDTYAYVVSSSWSFPAGGLIGSRASTLVSGTRPAMTMQGLVGGSQLSGSLNYPDPAGGGFSVHDAPFVYENFNSQYALRGFLPGMLQTAHASMATGNPLTTMCSIESNITGITGRLLRVCGWNLNGGEFFLKLDEDWGDV